jgi:hypothetical protein
VQGESRESGGGAGRPVRWHRTSIPAPHSCPHGRHRVAVNQDVKNQAVCSKYLPVRSIPLATPKSDMVRFEYEMSVSDGLGYAGSELGKLIYLHVPLQKLSLGDFEAASTDRDHAMVVANWRGVGVANYLLKNLSRFSLGCCQLLGSGGWDQLGSGGWESAWTGCTGGWCRFSAIRLRTAAHSECIWHANSQHKANVGL